MKRFRQRPGAFYNTFQAIVSYLLIGKKDKIRETNVRGSVKVAAVTKKIMCRENQYQERDGEEDRT